MAISVAWRNPSHITLYRIVQEALTNIANHAQASHASVWLRRVPGEAAVPEHLLLTVQDNGKGMDPQLAAQGLGNARNAGTGDCIRG